ncbi:hypothetical protein ACFQX6_14440 [Streptosporangium lutulentum]
MSDLVPVTAAVPVTPAPVTVVGLGADGWEGLSRRRGVSCTPRRS